VFLGNILHDKNLSPQRTLPLPQIAREKLTIAGSATTLESQLIHMIQELFGQTLKGQYLEGEFAAQILDRIS
jgi:hypothetical protein